jgi:hypothetical protein
MALAVSACGKAHPPQEDILPLDAGTVVSRPAPDAGESADSGTSYGSIAGQVVLVGSSSSAGVSVSLAPWGLSTTSNDDSGDFLLSPVPPGPFTLAFFSSGYARTTLSDVLAPGDSLFETVQLQRSIVLLLIDGGAAPDGGDAGSGAPCPITWITGGPDADAGPPAMYAATANTLYRLSPPASRAETGAWGATTALYTDPIGLVPLGVSPGGVAFFIGGETAQSPGDGGKPSIVAASAAGLTLAFAPEFLSSTAVLVGERLFFAFAEDAGGYPLMSWASLGANEVAPLPELDEILTDLPPVVFDKGLAGYRQQSPSCFQLMAFGGGAFRTLADCLPYWPGPLDSSLDGQWVTAVTGSISGTWAYDSFEVLGIDGGASALDDSSLVDCWHVTPLGADTLFVENVWGDIRVEATPQTLLYAASPLNWALRPGGSFIAQIDAGTTTTLATDNGQTTLPFAGSWTVPTFSPDGRFLVFAAFPTLFDLVRAAEHALVVVPASTTFSAQSDLALIVGADGSLAVVDLTSLPSDGTDGLAGQPVGVVLEGSGVTAAALTPDGAGVVYAGTDPAGRCGLFLEPAP